MDGDNFVVNLMVIKFAQHGIISRVEFLVEAYGDLKGNEELNLNYVDGGLLF